jgi:hypothetical protein
MVISDPDANLTRTSVIDALGGVTRFIATACGVQVLKRSLLHPVNHCNYQFSYWRGSPQRRVANLWTEFSALNRYRMVEDGKKCKTLENSLVAATFEKANTYVFAALIIRDREVGGSNPLAPTSFLINEPPLTVASIVSAGCPQQVNRAHPLG